MSTLKRAAFAPVALVMSAAPALAFCPWMEPTVTHMPEIDGSGSVAALAMLVSAGMIFYNRSMR